MSKHSDNKYFVILNKDKIIFSCLNNENKISFTKKHNVNKIQTNLFGELEIFFTNNLINIEKSLKEFIKKIYFIIDIDNSLSINLAIKYNFESELISEKKINDLLNYLKYQFTKYTKDQKIIHMSISKLLIDGKEKDLSQFNDTLKDLILEVKFECLKYKIVYLIKKILSKYQISVEKILIADYLKQSTENKTENIVYLANKFISSKNSNEVSWTNKKPYKHGFF
jgi:hypothetical protein